MRILVQHGQHIATGIHVANFNLLERQYNPCVKFPDQSYFWSKRNYLKPRTSPNIGWVSLSHDQAVTDTNSKLQPQGSFPVFFFSYKYQQINLLSLINFSSPMLARIQTMALLKKPSRIFFVMLFFLLTLSSALDMSIIDYDLKHGGQQQKRTETQIRRMYQTWLVKHGKAYNGLGENEKRFEIFKDNLKFIEEHNSVNRTYKVGLNRFADLTNEEYRAMYLGARLDGKTVSHRLAGKEKSQRYVFRVGDKLPESVDWREKGAVVAIKDQGQCVDMARLFARHGVKVTIATTPLNAHLFAKTIQRDRESGFEISTYIIKFPSAEVGLPEGCENVSSLPSQEMQSKFLKATNLFQQPLEQLLEELRPDCLVADMMFPWATDVARKFGIPRLVFHGTSCFSISAFDSVKRYVPHKKIATDFEVFDVPGLPDQIKMTKMQLPDFVKEEVGSERRKMLNEAFESERTSFGVIINSCLYEFGRFCFGWGCCPLESATCCEDHYSCCPQEYPICDLAAGTCRMSKDNPLGVKLLRRGPATSTRPQAWTRISSA
ncbi:uncharacterized protein LOC110426190 [Herrania umbratica]|uniref:Uncharacterized protein LOC110426190 n=1 Tax=Herrania umbratica TaxID=108875 RepID=A0A6J1BC10_9ROSI|nr:uncharacterized protein LOC110426190 [Herrania umbratica]